MKIGAFSGRIPSPAAFVKTDSSPYKKDQIIYSDSEHNKSNMIYETTLVVMECLLLLKCYIKIDNLVILPLDQIENP